MAKKCVFTLFKESRSIIELPSTRIERLLCGKYEYLADTLVSSWLRRCWKRHFPFSIFISSHHFIRVPIRLCHLLIIFHIVFNSFASSSCSETRWLRLQSLTLPLFVCRKLHLTWVKDLWCKYCADFSNTSNTSSSANTKRKSVP